MKEIVSDLDIKNLNVIRNGVESLILKASKLDKEFLEVLDIAPQIHDGASKYFLKSRLSTLDIDPKSNATYICDLCNNNSLLIPSDFFDVIICTEVLEHTLNPFKAVEEIKRILKPNGYCFVSTPFNFRIHGPLPDCWRFTEHGIRSLFNDFKEVEILAIESEDRFLMPIHYQTIVRK